MSTYINRIIRAARRANAADALADPGAVNAALRTQKDLTAEAVAAGVDRDLINWAGEIQGQRATRDEGTRDLADAIAATHLPRALDVEAPTAHQRGQQLETGDEARISDSHQTRSTGTVDQDADTATEITGDSAPLWEYDRQAAEQADTSIEPWLEALERAENSEGIFTLDHTGYDRHNAPPQTTQTSWVTHEVMAPAETTVEAEYGAWDAADLSAFADVAAVRAGIAAAGADRPIGVPVPVPDVDDLSTVFPAFDQANSQAHSYFAPQNGDVDDLPAEAPAGTTGTENELEDIPGDERQAAQVLEQFAVEYPGQDLDDLQVWDASGRAVYDDSWVDDCDEA